MSFLDKLKVKVEEGHQESVAGVETGQPKKSSGFMQLSVDIFQTPSEVIIYAPIPGVNISEIDISIENENDVVTIQGKRELPKLAEEEAGEDLSKKYLRQECQWGPFYRQIILPQEVNVAEVSAKFKKGVLVLRLPLLRLQGGGRKKINVNLGKSESEVIARSLHNGY
jgi:HSP20 family protein